MGRWSPLREDFPKDKYDNLRYTIFNIRKIHITCLYMDVMYFSICRVDNIILKYHPLLIPLLQIYPKDPLLLLFIPGLCDEIPVQVVRP